MKLNRKILMVLSIVLSLAMATGGTLAYLTDRDATANVFTVGDVDITLTESFEDGAELIPGSVNNNNVEKIPTITNTGKSDAYVWYVLSIPSELDDPDNASKNVIHFNPLGLTSDQWPNYRTQEKLEAAQAKYPTLAGVTLEDINNGKSWQTSVMLGTSEVDGIDYNHYAYLYNDVLSKGESTVPSLVQVYLDAHIDIDPEGNWHHVEKGEVTDLNWNSNKIGNPIIHISAYAIQSEGFADVNKAYDAFIGQWSAENGNAGMIDAMVFDKVTTSNPEDDDAFEDVIQGEGENIVVNMSSDFTYDLAAWQNEVMGSETTKKVIINGNGHALTFNNTDSDWNNVVTNGAKLVINNATINNAGHDAVSGTWNAHDINFNCDVEFNNVTFENAISLGADATLNNVKITDDSTGDSYMLWIRAKGQTVTLNGCEIDATGTNGNDRGIKIDAEYLKAEETGKVKLTVKNTSFKTESKAAILVDTPAGADITLENVNISGVAADSTNPVWVDGDSAAYFDQVTVTGGSVILEP